MDDEWQEYQYELAQYEKEHAAADNASDTNNTATARFADGTLAVDLGTIHLQLAHYKLKSTAAAQDKQQQRLPQIIITPEGHRYRFNGLVYNPETPHDFLVGRRALEQFSKSVLPFRLWTKPDSEATLQLALDKVLQPAITDALAQMDISTAAAASSNPGLTFLKHGRLRTVVALPTTVLHNPHAYHLFSHIFPPQSYTALIPEPVAAIWGAQAMNLLPKALADKAVLVLDVGGLETSLSIVRREVVEASVSLPDLGGQTFVEQLEKLILDEHAHLQNDSLARQRITLAAQDVMAEFSTKNNVKLHLPYISMDLVTRQPQHLETSISRNKLELAVTNFLKEHYVPDLLQKQQATSALLYLSPHVPTPTDFASFWASCLTQVLEVAQCSPFTIAHCLVVGGGSKHPLMESTLKSGLSMLGVEERQLVMPVGELRSELTVLGAATILPQYQYHVAKGLERRIDVDTS
jgi:hypothetical protein